jgi:hypothetical protein
MGTSIDIQKVLRRGNDVAFLLQVQMGRAWAREGRVSVASICVPPNAMPEPTRKLLIKSQLLTKTLWMDGVRVDCWFD